MKKKKLLHVVEDGTHTAVEYLSPYLEQAGPDVQVLAEVNGKAVIARQGKMLVTCFHPELTTDDRIHRYFLQMITE